MSESIREYFGVEREPCAETPHRLIAEDYGLEIPDRFVMDGKEFQKEYYRIQGNMKLCYSDEDNEEFIQFPEPWTEPGSDYFNRVVQGVVAKHNNEKLAEYGIPTLMKDLKLLPVVINEQRYMALRANYANYGENTSNPDISHDIPKALEEELSEELRRVGETVFEKTKEGELAYLENKRSWTRDLTNNRFIDLSRNEVGVSDLGEIGPGLCRNYSELDPHSEASGFVFYDDSDDWSYEDAPYDTPLDFILEHELEDDIEEFMDPRFSQAKFATDTENRNSNTDQFKELMVKGRT